MPSHVTPGALADEFTSPSGVLFRPVVSLLYLLPRHVTPGALADVFTSHSGVLLSPSRVTFGALADEFRSHSGVLLSLSNVIFVHTASCGIRVPAACLVESETFYARASGLFL